MNTGTLNPRSKRVNAPASLGAKVAETPPKGRPARCYEGRGLHYPGSPNQAKEITNGNVPLNGSTQGGRARWPPKRGLPI
jgi:hypothetical protein